MFSRLLYYAVLLPLSKLPLRVLYVLSEVLFFIMYHVFKYRRKVVSANLKSCFVQKTRSEITLLERDFYRHFCDIIVESIRLFSISEEEAYRRVSMENPELLQPYLQAGKKVIIVGGHYNNWEYSGAVFSHYIQNRAMGIYAPLNNTFFDEQFRKTRGKFGLELVSKKEVTPWFAQNYQHSGVVLFGADQSPTHSKSVYWTTFLNRESAVMTGTEKFAVKYNLPVVFCHIYKKKRGYYNIILELIEDQPLTTTFGEITEKHTRILEADILQNPQYWLWTHKRWKRQRKPGEQTDGSII